MLKKFLREIKDGTLKSAPAVQTQITSLKQPRILVEWKYHTRYTAKQKNASITETTYS